MAEIYLQYNIQYRAVVMHLITGILQPIHKILQNRSLCLWETEFGTDACMAYVDGIDGNVQQSRLLAGGQFKEC